MLRLKIRSKNKGTTIFNQLSELASVSKKGPVRSIGKTQNHSRVADRKQQIRRTLNSYEKTHLANF